MKKKLCQQESREIEKDSIAQNKNEYRQISQKKGGDLKRRYKWTCEQVNVKLHQISETDLTNLLAELWEILLPQRSQQILSYQAVLVNSERLSNSNRRTGR